MKPGYRVRADLDKNGPLLVFFVSRFCSKCMYNRRVLHNYLDENKIVEIDINSNTTIKDELQPRMVPTLVVIDDASEILLIEEGVISNKKAELLAKLISTG